jgi:hypothetical protein
METIICVRPLKDHKIEVLFNDGVRAEIDIRPFIKSQGMSQSLNDEMLFNTVKIDEAGGIVWENGFDFCPVFLRQIAIKKQFAVDILSGDKTACDYLSLI